MRVTSADQASKDPLGFKREIVLLLAVLAAALGMRMIPIASDLPYFCSSFDEMNYIENALRFGTGSLKMPSYFHGALYPLVLFVEYAAYFLLGRLMGIFTSATDFFLAYVKDPTAFVLLARTTVVLCGVGVVWLCYAIAARIYHQRVGLLAALFTAFSLLMFQMSFLALADILSVFLLMLATYCAVRSVEQPKERWFYCAATLVGLAAASKYHAGFGVVILYVVAFMKSAEHEQRTRAFVRLAVSSSVFVGLGFCLGMPQFLLEPFVFYEHVFQRLGGQMLGYNPEGNAWLFLFTHHLRNGLGIPLEVASLLGVSFALYNRSKWDVLMLSFPISFYLLFMHSVGWAYHLMPAIPFLFILAARCLDAIAEKLLRRESLAVSLLLGAVVTAPTFLDSIRFIEVMRSPSTKVMAKSWIEEHIPEGATIMAEGYFYTDPTFAPPLVENLQALERDLVFVKTHNGTGRMTTLRLTHYDYLYGKARAYDVRKVRLLDSEDITRDHPHYLIMTSAMDSEVGTNELSGMFVTGNYNERRRAVEMAIQRRDAVKEDVKHKYEILTTIAPTEAFTAFFPHLMNKDYHLIRNWPLFPRGGSKGPTITIWERRSEVALGRN